MKTFLLILMMLTMLSFQETNSFSASTSLKQNPTLIAGVCGCITEGNIQKTVLQQCKGLYAYDATTHKETKHTIISYEAVLIHKPEAGQIVNNSGAAFNEEVTKFIEQSKEGDQIIFRKIKVKAKGGTIQSLNSIPLTIE